jgi:hypothetical protein
MRSCRIRQPNKYQDDKNGKGSKGEPFPNHQSHKYQSCAHRITFCCGVHPTENIGHTNQSDGTDKKEKQSQDE